MKMYIQTDRGAVYEVTKDGCGGKCGLHGKGCSVARKEPCRKLTAFIEEVHMGCYGFKRLGRIRIEKDNFKPMPIDKWMKSKGGRMCARAIRGIKMEDIR